MRTGKIPSSLGGSPPILSLHWPHIHFVGFVRRWLFCLDDKLNKRVPNLIWVSLDARAIHLVLSWCGSNAFTNSIDPDVTSCLIGIGIVSRSVLYLTDNPICNNGCIQSQRKKNPLEEYRGERVINVHGSLTKQMLYKRLHYMYTLLVLQLFSSLYCVRWSQPRKNTTSHHRRYNVAATSYRYSDVVAMF